MEFFSWNIFFINCNSGGGEALGERKKEYFLLNKVTPVGKNGA